MGQLTKNEIFALAVQRYSDTVFRAAMHNCSSVSYTHLDVYKRQSMPSTRPRRLVTSPMMSPVLSLGT